MNNHGGGFLCTEAHLKVQNGKKDVFAIIIFSLPHSFRVTVSGTAPGCLRCLLSRLALCDNIAFYFVTSVLRRLPKRRVQEFCDMIILLL